MPDAIPDASPDAVTAATKAERALARETALAEVIARRLRQRYMDLNLAWAPGAELPVDAAAYLAHEITRAVLASAVLADLIADAKQDALDDLPASTPPGPSLPPRPRLPGGHLVGNVNAGGHRCEIPMGRIFDGPLWPVGTVWRCPCGRYWVVADPPLARAGQQRVLPLWRRATWRERRRARRNGLSS